MPPSYTYLHLPTPTYLQLLPYLPTYLPTSLPTYLPTYLPTSLPTYIQLLPYPNTLLLHPTLTPYPYPNINSHGYLTPISSPPPYIAVIDESIRAPTLTPNSHLTLTLTTTPPLHPSLTPLHSHTLTLSPLHSGYRRVYSGAPGPSQVHQTRGRNAAGAGGEEGRGGRPHTCPTIISISTHTLSYQYQHTHPIIHHHNINTHTLSYNIHTQSYQHTLSTHSTTTFC